MPVYNYHCDDCENVDELFRKIDERDDPAECTACGGVMTRHIESSRIVSGVGSVLAKTPPSWRNEVLEPMKKFYRGNTIKT